VLGGERENEGWPTRRTGEKAEITIRAFLVESGVSTAPLPHLDAKVSTITLGPSRHPFSLSSLRYRSQQAPRSAS
jgi:hypothetical protein